MALVSAFMHDLSLLPNWPLYPLTSLVTLIQLHPPRTSNPLAACSVYCLLWAQVFSCAQGAQGSNKSYQVVPSPNSVLSSVT